MIDEQLLHIISTHYPANSLIWQADLGEGESLDEALVDSAEESCRHSRDNESDCGVDNNRHDDEDSRITFKN
ncbi:hypothetical protein AWC38_SpisGene17156 [Stylophora pistillata]|uniref:Uncharacterized protein n=1 Tax=Stylophora pistillata TaxID=50429 RepID=A0A2B4RJA6_STYPI|nr:hypothetical protein AWC38_SpisGene17156 [Stylophora pistillata]